MSDQVRFDWQRTARSGVPEVVFAQGKSMDQLLSIAAEALDREHRILMTRVEPQQAAALLGRFERGIHWQEDARTLVVGPESTEELDENGRCVAIVAAGTSDYALVAEIEQCLRFLGVRSKIFMDVGVAGLWRLTEVADELRSFSIIVSVAGMEGALFSVLAGLVDCPIIAVPSPVGYGVSDGGHTALNCALASCAPGIAVVNIDNGFGAAALAVKILGVRVVDPG